LEIDPPLPEVKIIARSCSRGILLSSNLEFSFFIFQIQFFVLYIQLKNVVLHSESYCYYLCSALQDFNANMETEVIIRQVPEMMSRDVAPKKPPNKKLTVEKIYQKKSQLEHILLRPDTYIGNQLLFW
jgi:hypothetical protein